MGGCFFIHYWEKTEYTYNALGKVATVTDSMNHKQEYGYNSRGQNSSVKEAKNNTFTTLKRFLFIFNYIEKKS